MFFYLSMFTCRESQRLLRLLSPEMYTLELLSILVKSTLSHGHLTDHPNHGRK